MTLEKGPQGASETANQSSQPVFNVNVETQANSSMSRSTVSSVSSYYEYTPSPRSSLSTPDAELSWSAPPTFDYPNVKETLVIDAPLMAPFDETYFQGLLERARMVHQGLTLNPQLQINDVVNLHLSQDSLKFKFEEANVRFCRVLDKNNKQVGSYFPDQGFYYDSTRKLGKGAFGLVLPGINTISGKPIACKVHQFDRVAKQCENYDDGLRKAKAIAKREAIALQAVYQLHADIDFSAHERLTFMDFKGGQTLKVHLQKGLPNLVDRLKLGLQVVKAVQAQVHDYGYVHGDLKFNNMMFCPVTNKVTIVDFGMAQVIGYPRHEFSNFFYRAHRDDHKYLKASDTFSLGRMLWVLFTLSHVQYSTSSNEEPGSPPHPIRTLVRTVSSAILTFISGNTDHPTDSTPKVTEAIKSNPHTTAMGNALTHHHLMNLINEMTDPDPQERPGLPKVIESLEFCLDLLQPKNKINSIELANQGFTPLNHRAQEETSRPISSSPSSPGPINEVRLK